uniref:(northern house mosquito) hypothetical protein n=1 Tax=Culex pipiens TaxID=7175 RepID=A0A8D8A6G4_CULPI
MQGPLSPADPSISTVVHIPLAPRSRLQQQPGHLRQNGTIRWQSRYSGERNGTGPVGGQLGDQAGQSNQQRQWRRPSIPIAIPPSAPPERTSQQQRQHRHLRNGNTRGHTGFADLADQHSIITTSPRFSP